MIVEFLGPPAAGKSTVAAAVAERMGVTFRDSPGLKRADGTFVPVWPARRAAACHLLRQPMLAAALLSRLTSRKAANAASNLSRREGARRRLCDSKLTLVSEGPLFGVAMMAALGARDPQRLVKRVTQPDVLIELRVDPKEAALRRGNLRRAHVEKISRVVPLLVAAVDCPVATIDADRPLEDVISAVEAAIRTWTAPKGDSTPP